MKSTVPDLLSPTMSPENAAFWEAANREQLLIRRCEDCGECHWYPRVICPHCGSVNTTWVEATGEGTLYSFSITPGDAPKVAAYVQLDEGITMVSILVNAPVSDVRIGAKVGAVFAEAQGGQKIVLFELR